MNEQLTQTLGMSPIGFALLGADGTIEFASRSLAGGFGGGPVAGRPVWQLVQSLDADRWRRLRAETDARGAAEHEATAADGDGERSTLRLRLEPAEGCPGASPRYVLQAARVASDRGAPRPTETSRRVGKRTLDSILERLSTAVVVFGADGRVRHANSAARASIAAPPTPDLSAAIRERFAHSDVIDGLGRPMSWDALPHRVALRTGTAVYEQPLSACRDGTREWFLVSAVPRTDARGRVLDVVCTFTDVTESHRAERSNLARERAESLGRLAGGIAHHFNNLLTVMSTTADLLEHTLPGHALASFGLADLRLGAERGAMLTRQLLAYAAQQDRKPERIDLGRWLQTAGARLTPTLPPGVSLEITATSCAQHVDIDPTQLDQIISTLVANAGESFDDRTGTVGVEVCDACVWGSDPSPAAPEPDERGHYVVLRVTDDGRGMPASVEERAFEPFFTTKTLGNPSGLGLSACVGIARQNGGWTTIRSAPGRGTTVEVWLPAAGEVGGDGAGDEVAESEAGPTAIPTIAPISASALGPSMP